ncbi:MAG: hypothetical protein ACK5RL_01820 [Acidimicrobiales bacterium]
MATRLKAAMGVSDHCTDEPPSDARMAPLMLLASLDSMDGEGSGLRQADDGVLEAV